MLKSEVEKRRKALACKLKTCREVYGITFTAIQQTTGLSSETLCRIESGVKAFSVDSQITYLIGLAALIAKVKKEKPQHFKADGYPELNDFIKHHNYA